MPVVIDITIALLALMFVANRKLVKADPLAKPEGLVLLCLMAVEMIDDMVEDIVSPKYVEHMGPYIGSIALYILTANYVGLLGLDNPTRNFSCTLALAFCSWVLIQYADITSSGLKNYIHGFFEPIAPFVIPNIFSTISPMVSMSLRLFGNILSGSIIMSLVYSFTGFLTKAILPFAEGLDIFGPILAPALHAYFDIFSGAIQMYIFIMLTMVFTGVKIPDEAK